MVSKSNVAPVTLALQIEGGVKVTRIDLAPETQLNDRVSAEVELALEVAG